MSLSLPNFGGTMTGGSAVSLSYQNTVNGKATYTTPGHTRLTPETVEFLTTAAKTTATEPGVARAQLRITLADRQVPEEGCCTVQAGLAGFDVNFRWHLNQPESLVDDLVKYMQSLVFTTAFADMLKKGILPVG